MRETLLINDNIIKIMKNKIGIICLLLISVYFLSAVCAADLNETTDNIKTNDKSNIEVTSTDDSSDNLSNDKVKNNMTPPKEWHCGYDEFAKKGTWECDDQICWFVPIKNSTDKNVLNSLNTIPKPIKLPLNMGKPVNNMEKGQKPSNPKTISIPFPIFPIHIHEHP